MITDATTPLGLWRFSNEYLDAARIVGEHAQHEISGPHYYLLGHSIELALKAYLLANGVSIKALKKNISHNLESAYDRSIRFGLKEVVHISPEEEYSLRLLNKTYNRKEHEYIVIGYRHWPQPVIIRSLTERLLIAIHDQCCQ